MFYKNVVECQETSRIRPISAIFLHQVFKLSELMLEGEKFDQEPPTAQAPVNRVCAGLVMHLSQLGAPALGVRIRLEDWAELASRLHFDVEVCVERRWHGDEYFLHPRQSCS